LPGHGQQHTLEVIRKIAGVLCRTLAGRVCPMCGTACGCWTCSTSRSSPGQASRRSAREDPKTELMSPLFGAWCQIRDTVLGIELEDRQAEGKAQTVDLCQV